MTPEQMQGIVDKAGIHYTEAARLFDNITRQTLANWFKGIQPKNQSIYDRAQRICQVIQKATDVGDFPLTPGTPAKSRMKLIQVVIRQTNARKG